MSTPTRERLQQLEARRESLKRQCESFLTEKRDSGVTALSDRDSATWRSMCQDLDDLTIEVAEYRKDVSRSTLPPHLASLGSGGGRIVSTAGRLAPLHFPEPEVRRLRDAALRGESCRLETRFSTPEGLLPAQLFATPVEHVHEDRVLNRLVGYQMETGSLEFIRHTTTTGAAGPVSEGASKPEVTFVTDQITVKAVKLAAHNACSYEIISDWPAWSDYCGRELAAQVVDTENNQLLNGDGLTGNMVGFYLTSGILVHDCAADTGTNETKLDSVEKAVTKLRVGPALATPNLLVLNPSDWSSLRRTKDLQARYLTQPDPTIGEANSLWDINVVTTTQNPLGKGLLIDTTKAGYVGVRESIIMRVGYANDDLVKNLLRTVCEERLVLAVTRPSAVLAISGL